MADSNITKNALAASLKSLMSERPFDKISVSDICDDCGMNRKSFYYHFRDKYDLVNWIFYVDFIGSMDVSSYRSGWDLLLDLCRHFYADRPFYRAALMIEGQNSFHDYFLETVSPIANLYIREVYQDERYQEFFASFFGDAFLAAITRWISMGDMEPEVFIANLKSVSLGLAAAMLGRSAEEPEAQQPC